MLNNWTHKKHTLRSLHLVCIFTYKHMCTQLVACIQFVCVCVSLKYKPLMFLHTCKIGYQTHVPATQRNTWNSKAPCRTPLWTPATKAWLHVHTHTHTHIHQSATINIPRTNTQECKINISWSLFGLINGVNHLQTTNPDYSATLCAHVNLNSARLAVSFPPKWPVTHTATKWSVEEFLTTLYKRY